MTLTSLSKDSHFHITPFDHRGSMAKLFDLDTKDPRAAKVLSQIKVEMMRAFSPLASGVLVDPIYGMASLAEKDPHCGLIMPLEGGGYTDDPSQMPRFIENWSVHHVRENYAVAKLLLFFHPQEKLAEQKKKFVMEVYSSCNYEDISFLLEPILYFPGNREPTAAEKQELQLEMIQEFRAACDVMKIEYPGSALACATITAELDIPWILLSKGLPFDQYKEALAVSVENGCSGFAAGRAIWQEMGEMRTPDNQPDLVAITRFLNTTARERLNELIAITEPAPKAE